MTMQAWLAGSTPSSNHAIATEIEREQPHFTHFAGRALLSDPQKLPPAKLGRFF